MAVIFRNLTKPKPYAFYRLRDKKLTIVKLLTLCIIMIIILATHQIMAFLWVNWGSVELAHSITQKDEDFTKAQAAFENAISVRIFDKPQSATMNLGKIYAIQLNYLKAREMFGRLNVSPTTLGRYGVYYSNRQLPNVALVYFRIASELSSNKTLAKIHIRMKRICQQNYLFRDRLTQDNRRICQQLVLNYGGNLLADGQFENDINLGWSGTFHFLDPAKATVGLDETTGKPAPSLVLTGLTSGRHAGIYQRIALQPGTKVRFSGYFRAQNGGDLGAWLLYVEWRHDGRSQGSHFRTVESDMNWTYLEWVFTLPENSEPWVQFYPVLLIGKGKVWSDGIAVEILSE